MKLRFSFPGMTWLAMLLLSLPLCVQAQQQQQGVCARVKIEILQELTLERIGFEATLEVTDNDGADPITDFSAELVFEDPNKSTNGTVNDASGLFFVRAPQLENITDVSGTGSIAPTTKAVVRWFIIPKVSAGGTTPEGIRYRVGARLAGKFKGVDIPADMLVVSPDYIYVKPEPRLEITYFQPRDVQGDDPFTPVVESPIPFTIGVLVKNAGYGTARSVKINSQQPKIVEAKRNLLLIAQLLGARVSDSPLQNASLLVDLGDIPPGQCRKGAWDMITSLSGEFIEFKASYTHASELGGEETSVIKSINAHFIAHEVLNDQPGRDALRDFLADTDRDPDMLPDALYESSGNILPVNTLQNASTSGSAGAGGSFQVNLDSDRTGWGYMRLNDPGQAKFRIASVVRSDGKTLNTNNYWTNIRYEPITNEKHTYLNIFDLVDLGSYQYTVTYAPSATDSVPPVTTLQFVGSESFVGGKHYITPDTQMYFLSEDDSPVSIVYSVTNGPFLPALPFHLTTAGEYGLRYCASDMSGNQEATNTATLVVTTDPPSLASVGLGTEPIFASGDALSIRPNTASFTFQAQPNPTRVDATLEIFQGVCGWVTVSNTPSDPTSATTASLAIGGDHVDYYKYKLNGNAWSSEFPATQPIALTGLGTGLQTVSVLGRSQFGDYLAASNAVTVHWNVDPAAANTRIAGAPATPTRSNNARLAISGTGVTDYRWTINSGYYRAETSVTNPLVLTSLTGTQQVVAVVGKLGGSLWQSSNSPTTVSWSYDPAYGFNMSMFARVRTVIFTNIGNGVHAFSWDGRTDGGVILPPGWYTMRLVLNDQLGRTNFVTRLVQIGEITTGNTAVADVNRGAKNPHARGHWSVWQDQSDGTWQIYAQDLSGTNGPVKITSGTLSQENPQTDGHYVVWQSRQTNGTWDIWSKDLNGVAPAQAITTSSDQDEVSPAIDWPWVVYQSKPAGLPSAPWQLFARNLLGGAPVAVSPSTQDELDACVQAGRVVWQDFRDVGPGEIYFKDLENGREFRVTTNSFGQYHPAVFNEWIAWQDNRAGQVDIFGYNLLRSAEVRLTSTPENETRPFMDGPWLVCAEDSMGPLTGNLRLLHAPSLRAVPLTRSTTQKSRPALAGNRVVWEDTQSNQTRIVAADLPALQAVFQNRNAIAVTPLMATYQQNAFNLLSAWSSVGVQEITRYTALVPQVTSETASWNGGVPTGTNFNLVAGSFLWVKFDSKHVLDLGPTASSSLDFGAGINVFSYTRFPNHYSAYELLRQIGFGTARAVRMLDADSGRWVTAAVRDGHLVGTDFAIPNVAVLMLDTAAPVVNWKPE